MTYSKTHQRFSERLNEPEALKNPEKYLGPNYQDVLNFWIYIDTLSDLEKEEIVNRYWALDDNVLHSAIDASIIAADDVVGGEFSDAAWGAAINLAGRDVFGWATEELIGDVKNKVVYDLIMSHRKF